MSDTHEKRPASNRVTAILFIAVIVVGFFFCAVPSVKNLLKPVAPAVA